MKKGKIKMSSTQKFFIWRYKELNFAVNLKKEKNGNSCRKYTKHLKMNVILLKHINSHINKK